MKKLIAGALATVAGLGVGCVGFKAGAQEFQLLELDQRALEISSIASPELATAEPAAGASIVSRRLDTLLKSVTPGPREGGASAEPRFTLDLDAPVTYTDNAFRSEREESDSFFSPKVSLAYTAPVGQLNRVTLNGLVGTDRFADLSELDKDFWAGSGAFARDIGRFRGKLSYGQTRLYGTGFDDRRLTQHELGTGIDTEIRLGAGDEESGRKPHTIVTPGLNLSRALADPEEFDQVRLRAGLQIATTLSPKANLVLSPGATVSWYDDFFEETTGEDRRDINLGFDTRLVWRPVAAAQQLAVSGSVAFERNYSTLDASDYARFAATPRVNVSLRF